jgi:hypothetical protein
MSLKDIVSSWLWWISAAACVKQLKEDKVLAAVIFAILVLYRLSIQLWNKGNAEQSTQTNASITRNGWSLQYQNPNRVPGEKFPEDCVYIYRTPGGVHCYKFQ